MSPTKITSLTSLLLCLALLPSAAHAKDKSDADTKAFEKLAKEHFEQGKDYYNAGRYEDALVEFESAYRIQPSDELELNIGYAQWGMGSTEDAKKTFRRSYRTAKDPALRDAALKAMQSLSAGEIGEDGLTPLPRKVAQGALIAAGGAAALGVVAGGAALEQAFLEGKQGFNRPQGLINFTVVAFAVSVGTASVGAGIILTQHGLSNSPIKLFVSPTQASVAFQF